jgi:hypothetical protein
VSIGGNDGRWARLEKLAHWGHVLEESVLSLVSSMLCVSLLPGCHEVSRLFCHMILSLWCSALPVTGPLQRRQPCTDWNLGVHEPTLIFPPLSWFAQVFCYSDKEWPTQLPSIAFSQKKERKRKEKEKGKKRKDEGQSMDGCLKSIFSL